MLTRLRSRHRDTDDERAPHSADAETQVHDVDRDNDGVADDRQVVTATAPAPTTTPAPAPAPVPTPAERHERLDEREGWRLGGIGPGMVLGLIGAAGLVASMFMVWRDPSAEARDIPLAFLWDRDTTASDPSLWLALIPVAIVLVVGAVLPGGAPARIFAGVLAVVVVGLFALQLGRAADDVGAKLGDTLDTGFYVAAAGAVFGFLSGLMPSGWARRRTVVRADEAV